jgi:hypothetical protein
MLIGLLATLLALALAGIVALFRRYDRALHAQLSHERAVNAERAIRVLELEQLLDRFRVAGSGVTPPVPEELAARAHAARIDLGGGEDGIIPPALEAELAAISDPGHRDEMREFVAFRLKEGDKPDHIIAEYFA